MRWRFLKLDFPYLMGELAIVVLGISIAFSVEQCRMDKVAAEQEQLIIDRLLQDIEAETNRWGFLQDSLKTKGAALDKALDWVRNPDFTEAAVTQYLDNLVSGAQRAYGVGLVASTATFDELTSTGLLNALEDRGMRQAILDLYASTQREQRRATSRVTGYSAAVYRLIPRNPEYQVDPALEAHEKERIARRSQELDMEGLIIAERNLGRLMAQSAASLSGSAKQLTSSLRKN